MALNPNPAPSFQPSAQKVPLQTNYISYFDYSNQYDVEKHDELVNIYGRQSIAGMLQKLQSEATMQSDKFIWTEEGRLHTIYKDVTRAGNVFTKVNHVFRVGQTVHLSGTGAASAIKRRGVISAADANTFTVEAYKSAGFAALGTTGIVAFVDGSEFRKGTDSMEGSISTDFTILENKPIILKDAFRVAGSDVTQISWVNHPDGGYLWFLTDQTKTRKKWEDYVELAMLNGEVAETGSDAEANGTTGTEGLFEAIRTRGNIYDGLATNVTDFDDIVRRFDAQGKIQDYMFYVDRDQSLSIDNMLGELNAGYATGLSYGMFDNSKDMAVNLGFTGFTRGTYNFFKTDSRLFNDPTLLGAVDPDSKIRGVLIPHGTKEVYEGSFQGNGAGTKITTPFLQCMYRANQFENRKYKTWITGSVFGSTPTNGVDVMEEHHLSERMLNTIGANNFMLFEGN